MVAVANPYFLNIVWDIDYIGRRISYSAIYLHHILKNGKNNQGFNNNPLF